MAMHAGLGLSRIIIIFGAGYTGTVLVKHGKLSDLIGELQKMVKGLEPNEDSANSDSDAVTAEVLRLAQQVRQLASYNPQVTVLNGSSSQMGLSALIIPAGVLGTLGYGYMWWKGLSFTDLMWVTKRSMANAVSNLTKHLDSVSDTLAKAKKHLTQRIENLDGKVNDVKETTKLIKNDVSKTRVDLSRVGGDLSDLKNTVCILDGRIDLLEDKQNLTLAGVDWLCQIVDGKRVPTYQQFLQGQSRDSSKSRGQLPSTETLLPLGLKDIADIFTITDGKAQDCSSAKNNQARNILRIPSINNDG